MKILVTGGAGFIGSNFVRYMLDKYPDYQINVIDNLSTGSLSSLNNCHANPKFQYFVGNIIDDCMMEMLVEISDVVINFADESNTLNMCATNCIGAQVLSELCAQSNKRLIHISNYSVYGGYSIHPSREEELLVPRTPHAASKVAADELVIGYSEGRDLQSIIVRLVTAYGPNEKPNTGVANIITSAILGKDITVPNGNYEFMYVQDQCAVIDKILHSNKKTRIYNIGSGFRCGMLEISHIVKKALQSNCDVNVERISHPVQHGVSSDRAVFELGKYPVTYLKDGLMRTINWYLSNKAWWKDMIKE